MATRLKILLFALETHWFGAARLPRALQEAGFSVGVAGRAKAYVSHTRYRDQFFLVPEKNHGPGLLAGLEAIVRAWPPDCILPLDDRAVLLLAQAHKQLSDQGKADDLIRLLQRSLGNPAAIFEATSKARTTGLARRLGVRVPSGRAVDSEPGILEFAGQHGFPIVIKRSFGSGGNAVFLCANKTEVSAALARLCPKQNLKARMVLWREEVRGRQFGRDWLPTDQGLTVSRHIAGECATALTTAVAGRMLAALTAVRIHSYPNELGPCSVLRFTRIEEMRQAAGKLVRHWGLTGLIGFDFILDAAGQAWLLECNPRATPIAHLGWRVGEDLCAALHAGLTGAQPPPPPLANEVEVAHYPTESWRDPKSSYLAPAYHDVPEDDPGLVAAFQRDRPH